MKLNGTPLPSGEGKRSAAAGPDPEVSAKATRRRFTAAYKLSIVEQADACRRRARSESCFGARGCTVRTCRRGGRRRGRGRSGGWRRSAARGRRCATPQGAHHHRCPGKSCGAAGREPRGREALLRGRGSGRARTRGVRPSGSRAPRSTVSRPGPGRSGAHGGLRRAVLAALRGPRSRKCTRRCWTRASICVRSGRCTASWPRTGRSGSAGPSAATRTTRSPRSTSVVPGTRGSSGRRSGGTSISTSFGHLQPLRHRMAGGGARDRRPPDTWLARRVSIPGCSRCTRTGDDGQVHGAAPGRHAVERQPLLGGHFKTVKYHPAAGSVASRRRRTSAGSSSSYNTEHRHGGIGLLTPQQVHLARTSSHPQSLCWT